MTITIKAIRDYQDEPVFAAADLTDAGEIKSAVAEDGRAFPAERREGGVLVIATMKRGETLALTLSDREVRPAVELRVLPETFRTEVYLGGKFFTAYVYDTQFKKPYLGPVMAEDGKTSFTRLDFEIKEHPHQRSIIGAVGDVNGVDFWNENANFGLERHQGYALTRAGAASATVSANILWQSVENVPFVDERRTYTFYNQAEGCRYIDIEMAFTATYGDVHFGPTKEAGPLGVRMNEALRADRGSGHFVNSYGGQDEAECWSKCASFCDYKGEIDGHLYGVAIFDNEKNERYPTAWHIRNYGLFAANNLYFKGGLTIPKGETLTYRFRLCFYEDTQRNISDKFNSYVAFSTATVK